VAKMRLLLHISGLFISLLFLPGFGQAEEEVYPVYPQLNHAQSQQPDIARGVYLTKAGDCIACHSDPKHGGKAFAGGLGIKTPFGTFYTPNITPDKDTGIGSWTNDQFIRAMQEGRGPDGANYFPVFPYNYFTRVNTQDLRDIKAYLDNIPAVHRENTPIDVLPPFSFRFMQWGWKLLFFQFHRGAYHYNPARSTEWNRGAYLVQGLGHCAMCHSPLNLLGAVKSGQALTGGFVDGFYAPDITSRGLGDASVEDIINVFQKNEMLKGAGKVQGPMAEVNYNSLQHLTTKDLKAIAVYLKSVPNLTPLRTASTTIGPDTGRNIYDSHCAVCHNAGAAGAPRFGDAKAWQPRIAQGMETVFNHAVNGYNSMPPKGACISCSDNEIKAAVEYLVDKSKAGASGAAPKSYVPTQPPLTLEEGKHIYEAHCAVCHSQRQSGAPVIGNKEIWAPILDQNMDVLFKKSLSEHSHLSQGNNCTGCSDAEIIAATKYIAQQSQSNGRNYSLW
jgi:cytochrome c5